jgi:hypothetical protein
VFDLPNRVNYDAVCKGDIKQGKMVVVCYGVEILTPPGEPVAARLESGATPEPSAAAIVAPEPPVKVRKP